MQEEAKLGVSVNSKARMYPKMWSVVKKIFNHMAASNWQQATNATNKTDFRRKILTHLLEARRRVLTSEADSVVLLKIFKPEQFVWYYDFGSFKAHAKQHMKHAKKDVTGHTANDAVRVFGILGLADLRDKVTRLGRGRAVDRADLDGPLTVLDETFTEVARHFNDRAIVVTSPPRADRLEETPDPNDPARIVIERDFVWCKKVYSDWLKMYNLAMKKWKSGTGGGSGYPENYCDWNTCDEELLSNYHGSPGKSDALAWIYMLDKSLGYIFNVINDPPPAGSVMQDGVPTVESTNRRGVGRGLAGLEDFTSAVTSAVTNVTNLVQSSVENRDKDLKERRMKGADDVEGALNRITLLQEQRKIVEDETDLERKQKRLKLIDSALDAAFAKLAD